MLVQILFLILGLILVTKGADWLVEGASSVAKKYKISDLAIGLTIVAFGTSAPELVVNAVASYEGLNEIVLGNIIGSNNFNLFIILGITGLITPLVTHSNTVWREIPLSLAAALLLLLFGNNFFISEGVLSITFWDGIVLLALFSLFIIYVFTQLKSDTDQSEGSIKIISQTKSWVYIALGLTGLVLGGRLFVDNAEALAFSFGVSEKVIGLTIVAAGTSLPELATSVVAALKKNIDIAVGNIIGSNIFNILLILAVSSFINPVQFEPSFNTEIYILIGGTIFLFLAMFTGKKKTLDRWEAGLLLLVYLMYVSFFVL